ncbi:MAG TPA: hypothetical protein VGL66_00760 [Caulobacteraceae bacterium]
MRAYVLTSFLTIAMSATSVSGWRATVSAPCPRCVDAELGRKDEPLPIPERAIVFSFTGEFATEGNWLMVDLDTGQVTERAWTRKSMTVRQRGVLKPKALSLLRTAAAERWRSPPLAHPTIPPGTVEEDYIISGARLMAFSRFAPEDKAFVDRLTKALREVGIASEMSGSFVIRR